MTAVARASGVEARPARSALWTWGALVGYASFAIVWLGRNVVLHPESRVFGDKFADKTIVMWSFLWWPHRLLHGHDPFVTKAVWAPHGIDLAWVTAMPGASVLLTPFTETVGPVFAYNLAALAAPPLAAWATFLLARRLTGDAPAALVAGFLFGFSPYLMGQASSHLNLSLVFLVPLLGLLAVMFVQGDLGRWRYVGFFALALASQFYFSTEIVATVALVGVISLALAFALLRELRERLRSLAANTLIACAVAGLFALPYLLHAFAGGTAPPARGYIPASADLANLVVPTRVTWLRVPGADDITQHFASNGAEQGAYLGIPLLVILVVAAVTLRGRRRRGLWLLLLAAVATTALALGRHMLVDGHEIATGPWQWLAQLPAIHSALPIRLDMYTTLFVALAVALWLAQPGRRRGLRFALAGLALVALLPNPTGPRWASDVPQSTLFTTGAYRTYLLPGETALVIPYGGSGWSMLWQAETHFRFSMIGGWVGRSITSPECEWYWEYRDLMGVRPADGGVSFRRFLLAHHVRAVIEAPGTQPSARRLIATSLADVRPRHIADAIVLPLPPNLPRALPQNAPPLAASTLPQSPPAGLPCVVAPYSKS